MTTTSSPAPLYGVGLTLDKLERTHCDRCGSSAILGQYYRWERRERLCPRCLPGSTNRSLLWAYLFLLASVIGAAALVGSIEGGFATLFVVNALIGVVILHLLIIPHELIHAAVARLLGGQVFAIHFGLGTPLWSGRWRGMQIFLRQFPVMGMCIFGLPQPGWIRLRYGLVTAAPLVGHLIFAVWLWPQLNWVGVWTTLSWREMLMFANGFLLITNLFPNRSAGAGLGTDGLKLWGLITGKITAQELHSLYFAVAAGEKFQAQEAEAGLAIADAGIALYPDHLVLQTNRLGLLLQAHRYEEALPLLIAKLAGPYPDPLLQALDLNNAAWSILMLARSGQLDGTGYDLAQGKEYAEWAFAMLPWLAAVEGTWAAYLLEIGETEQAIVHSLSAAKHQEIAEHRATNLAHAAVGHHRLGQHDEARALLAQAQSLAPQGAQVRWAAGQLR
ncbi:MAG: hypothetical protein KF893_20020 [Caldilineaceae bacterium]|nr:hypothetical protein [Caldilineaceae bacterium]